MEKPQVYYVTEKGLPFVIDNCLNEFLDRTFFILPREFDIIHDKLIKEDKYMFSFNERALLSIFCNAFQREMKTEEVQIIQELSTYSDAKRADALIFLKYGKEYQLIVEAKAYNDNGSRDDKNTEYIKNANEQAKGYIEALKQDYKLDNLYLLTIYFNCVTNFTEVKKRDEHYKPESDNLDYYYVLCTGRNTEAALQIYGNIIPTKYSNATVET
jgi:hypothetical protein